MIKTTLYLPEDLKRALEREAKRRETSEADVVRQAIAAAVGGAETPVPRGGIITGEWAPIDWDSDDWLEGFGAR